MKCILVEKIGSFGISEKRLRPILEDEVLVKVNIAGLCRTDLKLIRVGHHDLSLPRIPGEEVVGVVSAKGVDVRGFECGQRVYIYPGVWCGQCSSCLQGAENLCEKMEIMGFHRDGGFAQYVIAPAKSLLALPDDIIDEEAVLIEPLSCCLNALELAQIKKDKTVAIWGAGPAGTLINRAAKVLGARTVVIEPDMRRCELIKGCRIAPNERFDVCIVAVGSDIAYQEASSRLNPRGRLVVFSGLSLSTEQLAISFNQMHYYEQTIVGAYGCCYKHSQDALRMINGKMIEVCDMVSHRFSMPDLDKALSIVENKEGMKVLMYPSF